MHHRHCQEHLYGEHDGGICDTSGGKKDSSKVQNSLWEYLGMDLKSLTGAWGGILFKLVQLRATNSIMHKCMSDAVSGEFV